MDIKQIEAELSKFIYDLATEDRLVRVGLKDKAQSQQVYVKYKDLFGREVLDFLKLQIRKAHSSKAREIAERIYFTIASSFIGWETAGLSDDISTYFAKAKVIVNGESLAYYQLSPKIAKETIFEKRERYDDWRLRVIEKINPKQLKLLECEINLIKKLGFGNYLDYFLEAKKVDYERFYKTVEKLERETDDLWLKVIGQVSREVLGRPFKKIGACHLIYLRSASMFDSFYPKDRLVATFLDLVKKLGLSDLLARIEIDDKDRPAKNPRAVCYWPKPPSEIHLIIKPIGGEQDYEAMLHEGGHALHGAAVSEKLPYALKTLSRSGALTETLAYLFEDLAFEPFWLSTFLNVSAFSSEKIKWQATFVNLMMLRRYLGKFMYEYQMFSKNALSLGPVLYAKMLFETTGFVTSHVNWLSDMDRGFYSADYLRAWIAGAEIKDYLRRRFGTRWFLTGKAGKFLRGLFERGVTDDVEDVVSKLGYKPWDTSYLIKGYAGLSA